MKVLHVMASSDIADGGAVQAVKAMAPVLAGKGVTVKVAAPRDRNFFSRFWLGFSLPMTGTLFRDIPHVDLVHVHGLWYYPQFMAFWAARTAGTPVVLSIHGELGQGQFHYRAFRKRIYSAVIQKKIVRDAEAIHALSAKEAEEVRAYSRVREVFIIPNGVAPDAFEKPADGTWISQRHPDLAGKRVVLFLGRVNEGKGLDVLTRAMGMVTRNRDDVRLVIAGPDHWGYGRQVDAMLKNEGIGDKAVFTGMLNGDEKRAMLQHACMLVLPSRSEGFSVSVLEAMACCLPVVISRQCNFPQVEEKGCGRVLDNEPRQFAQAIGCLLDDPSLARSMGVRGKKLIREEYDLNRVADDLIRVYERLISRKRRGR